MARIKSKPTMNAAIQRGIEQILAAMTGDDERRAAYLKDPHPWQPERERHLSDIAAERERSIIAAADMIDRESESIEAAYRRSRKTSFDSTAVAEAWRRTREQLDAGLGLADVPIESREQAEAIRENVRSHFTSALKGARRETVEASVREILDHVDRSELPLITDRAEQSATERELERRAGHRAVEAVSRFVRERRAGIPADASSMLSLGHALASEGYVPATPPEDRAAAAERERNSLPPELRDALDSNAADAGPRSPGSSIVMDGPTVAARLR